MCPYAECAPTGSADEEKKCRSQTGKTCYTLALRRSIKEKLRKLGLVGYGPDTNTKKIITKKIKKSTNTDNGDIVIKIRELKELLDAGVITQDEFKKAKKKILN